MWSSLLSEILCMCRPVLSPVTNSVTTSMSLRPNGTWDVQVQQDRHLVRHDRNQRQCVQEVYGLLIVCNNFTIQAPGHRMAGSGCHKQGKSIAHGAKDTCLPITSLAW
ncbi:hypothetical protein BD311DRAFT_753924 [Dichomitus squalens]|uniref:Secreted protein n=1 Tax=Dichomitus squalens TaxID=114155 RepID=A0A4Q9MU14_9APHY|nr:hypothetical protein BD311DRAFT_753924 [Dichomitus squalens]